MTRLDQVRMSIVRGQTDDTDEATIKKVLISSLLEEVCRHMKPHPHELYYALMYCYQHSMSSLFLLGPVEDIKRFLDYVTEKHLWDCLKADQVFSLQKLRPIFSTRKKEKDLLLTSN